MNHYGLSDEEWKFFRSLNTPEKIQDYIDNLNYNFCDYPDKPYECKSPKRVLEEKSAHCFEGALFASAALRINGNLPLVTELDGPTYDDHILALFKRKGLWGAIAKSQFYTLTWRDPIFRSIRELVLSYFPFYVINGAIQLRTYTNPVNLKKFDYMNWISTDKSLEELGDKLYYQPTHQLFPPTKIRKVSPIVEKLMRKYPKPQGY